MPAQHKPPTVYDLMNEGSVQRIQKMFNAFGFEIKIDPLAISNANQSKENVISQILKDFDTSPRILKLIPKTKLDITDLEDIVEAAKEKDFKDYNFYNFIRCLVLNSLITEASVLMFQQEKLKEMQVQLHKMVALLSDAEYNRQVLIAEEEQLKAKMDAIESKLNAALSQVLNQTYGDSLKTLHNIRDDIQSYDARLAEYKVIKKGLREDLRSSCEKRAEEIIKTNPHLKSLLNDKGAQEDLTRMLYEYKNDLSRIDRTLYKIDQRTKKFVADEHAAQTRELDLNKRLQQLAIKEMELKHHYPDGFPPPVKRYGVKGRIADPGKLDMIQQEVESIRAELSSIAKARKERNKKQTQMTIRLEENKAEKAKLFDVIMHTTTNEKLIKLLQKDKVRQSLLNEFNVKTDPEDALFKNTQNKVDVQALKKAKHKEAKQIVSQNEKVHKLHQSASKHEILNHMPDNHRELLEVHGLLDEQRNQEKQRKRDKKANREKRVGLR